MFKKVMETAAAEKKAVFLHKEGPIYFMVLTREDNTFDLDLV